MEEGRRQGRASSGARCSRCAARAAARRAIAPPEPGSGEGRARRRGRRGERGARSRAGDCAATTGPTLPAAALPQGWTASGRATRRSAAARTRRLTIGVIADAGGATRRRRSPRSAGCARSSTPRTSTSWSSLGGMGATQAELEATLGALADRAPRGRWSRCPATSSRRRAHDAAIAALRQRGATVIDGRLARWIELAGRRDRARSRAPARSRAAGRRRRRLRLARRRRRRARDRRSPPSAGLRIAAPPPRRRAHGRRRRADRRARARRRQRRSTSSSTARPTRRRRRRRTGGRDGAAASLSPGHRRRDARACRARTSRRPPAC